MGLGVGRQFEQERTAITRTLGELDAAIEHIGSTAVPNLAAKPVIDVLVGVNRPVDDEHVTFLLIGQGYESLGEGGVAGRLYFRKRELTGAFNVHVVQEGSQLWQDNLMFRDYLRTHPEDAAAYVEVKTKAAQAASDSLIRYSTYKADFIATLLDRARSGA